MTQRRKNVWAAWICCGFLIFAIAFTVATWSSRFTDPKTCAGTECVTAEDLPDLIPLEIPDSLQEVSGLLHSNENGNKRQQAVKRVEANLSVDGFFLVFYPIALIAICWSLHPPSAVGRGLLLAGLLLAIATGVSDHFENAGLWKVVMSAAPPEEVVNSMTAASLAKWGLLGSVMLVIGTLQYLQVSPDHASGWQSLRLVAAVPAGLIGIAGAFWKWRGLFTLEFAGLTVVILASLALLKDRGPEGGVS